MADSTPIDTPLVPDSSVAPSTEETSSIAPAGSNHKSNNEQDTVMGGVEESNAKDTKPAEVTASTPPTAPQPAATATTANGTATGSPSNTPARTGTPTLNRPNDQPNNASSRAPSAVPADRGVMPASARENGGPTRVYLNNRVTKHVMDGMKVIAKDKPDQPLRILAEFLLKRSAEHEGTGAKAGGETGSDAVAASDKKMDDAEQ